MRVFLVNFIEIIHLNEKLLSIYIEHILKVDIGLLFYLTSIK